MLLYAASHSRALTYVRHVLAQLVGPASLGPQADIRQAVKGCCTHKAAQRQHSMGTANRRLGGWSMQQPSEHTVQCKVVSSQAAASLQRWMNLCKPCPARSPKPCLCPSTLNSDTAGQPPTGWSITPEPVR